MSTDTTGRPAEYYRTREYLAGRPLTPREHAIVTQLADGQTSDEIARTIRPEVTYKTAVKLISDIGRKLEVKLPRRIVAAAYKRQILRPGSWPGNLDRPRLDVGELALLRLLVEAATTEHIASELGVQTATVSFQLGRLLYLMHARTPAHLVRRAVDLGIRPAGWKERGWTP
jgi:DNA-binding NarL/FixJ family response regulator